MSESELQRETVYFTEEGVDLQKIFPEVAELQLAMAAGCCWSDVEQYHPTQFAIPRKPIRVLYTTEAEKKRLLGTQVAIIPKTQEVTQPVTKPKAQEVTQPVTQEATQEATQEVTQPVIQEVTQEATQETSTVVQAYVVNILADLQKQSQEKRLMDDIASYLATAIYNTPENLHTAILDGVAHEAAALIQGPIAPPQVDLIQDKQTNTNDNAEEESGYFKSLYNRAYNYLASWIY